MPETSLIPIETKKKIEEAYEFYTSILNFFSDLKEIKFRSYQEYENGVELCKQAKRHLNILEQDRKDLVKPLNDEIDDINNGFKDTSEKLKNFETVLKEEAKKRWLYNETVRIEKQEKANAEVNEKIRLLKESSDKELEKATRYRSEGKEKMAEEAEARMQRDLSIASTIIAPIIENETKIKGISFTPKKKIVIGNIEEAIKSIIDNPSLHKYLNIDTVGLLKKMEDDTSILVNGVRIVNDAQVSIRTK